LTGSSVIDFVHADDKAAAVRALEALKAGQTAGLFEARILHRDGSYRWVSWNATPIATEQCLYVVGRDITELKKSQQLFEGVLQSAPDAMVIVDPQGRIILANRQAERVFGYNQDEMVGQPVEMLVPEQVRERHPGHVASFFASSSVRPMGAGQPLRGRRKDGREFLAEVALSPITTESGKLVAASVRDASDRHQAAETLFRKSSKQGTQS
jgi:PAS domain S-box-containing protein